MEETDLSYIKASIESGTSSHDWHTEISIYEKYYTEQSNGNRYIFIAVYDGNLAGYATLKKSAGAGPFASKRWPEVSDFNVFERYRRKGIGSKILDAAERTASEFSDIITLGVGLHSGYGQAQRMYVKRGYLFDGSGVWYKDKISEPYTSCCNDDDLVLYLSKRL